MIQLQPLVYTQAVWVALSPAILCYHGYRRLLVMQLVIQHAYILFLLHEVHQQLPCPVLTLSFSTFIYDTKDYNLALVCISHKTGENRYVLHCCRTSGCLPDSA